MSPALRRWLLGDSEAGPWVLAALPEVGEVILLGTVVASACLPARLDQVASLGAG